MQMEADAGDDVAVGFIGIEEAFAVAEAAVGAGELGEGAGLAVEGADGFDGLCDLLPVGADVLDGRAADLSGDPGEALDACHVEREGVVDEGVPVFAGGDVEAAIAVVLDAAQRDVQDEARKATVAYEQVAAAAEDKQRQAALTGPGDGGGDVVLGGGFGEVACRAADAEGGVRGERDGFADSESRHDVEGTTGPLETFASQVSESRPGAPASVGGSTMIETNRFFRRLDRCIQS